MLVDVGTALFAFGLFALVLENFVLALATFGVAFYCVS
jgi:hypothetical protein